MLRAGAGRRLRTHIHVTEIGIPKSFFLERENSWEILQYLGKTKANQILKPYMPKTCDVAEKAILAKKKLRKKCVNRDKM